MPLVLSLHKRYDWKKASIRQITNLCAHMYGEDLHKLDIISYCLLATFSMSHLQKQQLGTDLSAK